MRTVGKLIGFLLRLIVVIVLHLMPWGGLLFLVVILVSGEVLLLNALGVDVPVITELVPIFFQYGWKVYLATAVFTLFVMTTICYMDCCAGRNSFSNHLRHFGHHHWPNFWIAVLWPCTILMVHLNLRKRSKMGWPDVVIDVVKYWLVNRWRVSPIEYFNIPERAVAVIFVEVDPTDEELLRLSDEELLRLWHDIQD